MEWPGFDSLWSSSEPPSELLSCAEGTDSTEYFGDRMTSEENSIKGAEPGCAG